MRTRCGVLSFSLAIAIASSAAADVADLRVHELVPPLPTSLQMRALEPKPKAPAARPTTRRSSVGQRQRIRKRSAELGPTLP